MKLCNGTKQAAQVWAWENYQTLDKLDKKNTT